MTDSDYNNEHYQKLVQLADHLDAIVDSRQETFGGALSNHVDPTNIGSELWV
jgi:hypothetical protein